MVSLYSDECDYNYVYMFTFYSLLNLKIGAKDTLIFLF